MLDSAKKHSVLYKTEDKTAPVQSVYIKKEAFEGTNFPETITLNIEGE